MKERTTLVAVAGTLRLVLDVMSTLKEAQIIIEEWRSHYNTKRPHSALGYRPPAPETIVPMDPRLVMH